MGGHGEVSGAAFGDSVRAMTMGSAFAESLGRFNLLVFVFLRGGASVGAGGVAWAGRASGVDSGGGQ